jgi:hypothetical protein
MAMGDCFQFTDHDWPEHGQSRPEDVVLGILRASMPAPGDAVEMRDGRPHMPALVATIATRVRDAVSVGALCGRVSRPDALAMAYAFATMVQIDAAGVTYRLRDCVDLEGLLR